MMNVFEHVLSVAQDMRAVIDSNIKPPAVIVRDYKESHIAHNTAPEVIQLFELSGFNYSVAARYSGVTDSAVWGWLGGNKPKDANMEKIKSGIKRLKKLKEKRDKHEQ